MIYMASGFSRRFGENKLFVDFCGKPLYRHGLDCLIEVKKVLEQQAKEKREKKAVEILVVSQYEQIKEEIAHFAFQSDIKFIKNTKSEDGISASIRLGTAAAKKNTDIFVYFVADQPYMSLDVIIKFLLGFLESEKGIGAVSVRQKRRNPAAFSKKYKEQLLCLCSEQGGSHIIKAHTDDLWLMEVEEKFTKDIDTREDMLS